MNEESLSTKEMLLNIWSMRAAALKLASNGKGYSGFLKILLENYYNDDDLPFPSLKEFSVMSGLRYEKVRKYIADIYQDLVFDGENRPVFSITKVKYTFNIRGRKQDLFMSMVVAQLPVLPRVGEEVSIPFFSAYLKEAHFYVEEVRHKLEEDTHTIEIWVQPGYFNSYWQFRKDKAKEENELSSMDFFSLSEFELKKKLKVGRWR
jgi:hypothetical protein